MADLSIKLDTTAVTRKLAAFRRQISFVVAGAINDLAFQAMRAENAAMSDIFAHPRPFTHRSAQVEKRATKADLTAVVSLRDAQAKYLTPYETGGPHETPGKALLVPADVRLDQYGQLPKGAIKRLAARPDVFFGTVRGITGFWLRPPTLDTKGRPKGGRRGAMNSRLHQNTGLTLLLRVGQNKPVTKRLNFRRRAIDIVERKGADAIRGALQKALATARP
ncbi:hypothetical protein AA13595_1333 [Gluconacetobacter johannae DSM 13595]|uniref:Uncharacterized protein n=1 Tax=Gluconacetobacter johannae TaxID=112140 RepID=A0A7W4J8Q4_9PROT|nr:hypothetical protein [Gluconacetobacter johannae]MBB2176761.1 hypothetical protein [Gluconacetobacter johannae]GBQ84142.1 hypothetical protein AA13595_1333 [Gluconacetobacter johannae DSM 13595]